MTWRPLLAVALRQAAELRDLRNANTYLTMALALQRHTTQVVSRKYELALRDATLLAAGWRDPDEALAFIETAHDIENLIEGEAS
jgi:hypothetical protein